MDLKYDANGINAEKLSDEESNEKVLLQLIVTRKQTESLIIRTNSSSCPAGGVDGSRSDSGSNNGSDPCSDNKCIKSDLIPRLTSLSDLVKGINDLIQDSVEKGSDGKRQIIFRLENFNGSIEAIDATKGLLNDLKSDLLNVSRKVDAYGIVCIILLLLIIGMIGYMIYSQKKVAHARLSQGVRSTPNTYSNGHSHSHGNGVTDCDCNLHY